MHCIFCKEATDSAKSIEHIIPESLGNVDHTLAKGTICDSCNNYFANKIENPVLSSGFFRYLRNDRNILSKKKHLPTVDLLTISELPDYRTFTRFIGKIGLEVLAFKTSKVKNWNQEIVDKYELDAIRQYVRYNKGKLWPVFYRTLYPVNAMFEEQDEIFEILNEFDLLYTEKNELYIVVAIFGVEFVMNLGGPELDGYEKWLEDNKYDSWLYNRKNA